MFFQNMSTSQPQTRSLSSPSPLKASHHHQPERTLAITSNLVITLPSPLKASHRHHDQPERTLAEDVPQNRGTIHRGPPFRLQNMMIK